GDVTLLSDNVELLALARTVIPAVRTAVDFSALALGNTVQDILQVVSATNRAKAKIAVLPVSMTQRTTVAHLQRLLITPWASSSAATATAAAEVLTTGVNGVIAADARVYAEVLRKLPANTLLRKPLVTGHRGMPGTTDENTLEGAKAAVAAGADAVENDIYMTTDRHLVIMHDDTVTRTTTGTGRIETMTLAEVKALKTKPGGHAVPTLQEFFAEFKGRNITHFIELKSTTAGIVPLLKEEVEKAGVKDQVVAISFSGDQLNRMAATLPEISTGLLNSNVDNGDVGVSLRNIFDGTQLYSSTYNPSYANGPKQATMEAGKHRGITFWPWTLNNEKEFYRFYSYGTHGLTTDHAYWAKDFPVAVSTPATATVAARTAFSVPLTLTSQVGATRSATSNQLVVLDGAPAHSVAADGSVTFTATGTASVLPGYTYKMGDGTYSYTIFGKPMTITVTLR
ncbi:MAG: glycerophosphodiester phosphodiesterase family protein, partial [Comamonas sp.]